MLKMKENEVDRIKGQLENANSMNKMLENEISDLRDSQQ